MGRKQPCIQYIIASRILVLLTDLISECSNNKSLYFQFFSHRIITLCTSSLILGRSGFTVMVVVSVNCRSSTSSLIAVGVAVVVIARCTVSGRGKIHTNSDNFLNALRNDIPLKKNCGKHEN